MENHLSESPHLQHVSAERAQLASQSERVCRSLLSQWTVSQNKHCGADLYIWWLMLDVNLAGSRITHETNLPSHLRETIYVILPSAMAVRGYLDYVRWSQKPHPKNEWHHFEQWGPELNEERKTCRGPACLAVSTMWPAVPGSCCRDFHPHGPWAKVKPSFPELLLPRHLVTSTGKKCTPGRNLSCYQQS